MANIIQNTTSKISNNPLGTILGGVATYYILSKRFPTAQVTTNKYMFIGTIVLGSIAGAYLSSRIKQSNI